MTSAAGAHHRSSKGRTVVMVTVQQPVPPARKRRFAYFSGHTPCCEHYDRTRGGCRKTQRDRGEAEPPLGPCRLYLRSAMLHHPPAACRITLMGQSLPSRKPQDCRKASEDGQIKRPAKLVLPIRLSRAQLSAMCQRLPLVEGGGSSRAVDRSHDAQLA